MNGRASIALLQGASSARMVRGTARAVRVAMFLCITAGAASGSMMGDPDHGPGHSHAPAAAPQPDEPASKAGESVGKSDRELFAEGVQFARDGNTQACLQRFSEVAMLRRDPAGRARATHNAGVALFTEGEALLADRADEALQRYAHAERAFLDAALAAREARERELRVRSVQALERTRARIAELRATMAAQERADQEQQRKQQEQDEESMKSAAEGLAELAQQQRELAEQAEAARAAGDQAQSERLAQQQGELAQRTAEELQRMRSVMERLAEDARKSAERATSLAEPAMAEQARAQRELQESDLADGSQHATTAAELLERAAAEAEQASQQQKRANERGSKPSDKKRNAPSTPGEEGDESEQRNPDAHKQQKGQSKGGDGQSQTPVDPAVQELLDKERREREASMRTERARIVPVPKVERDW